ncbi:MAG TPA: hypothetical protein VMT89_00965, partial [Candidatus Acidoferrales bacterium]|nr:hypothetical protein [Candidatus Acidoferrales bacterium]
MQRGIVLFGAVVLALVTASRVIADDSPTYKPMARAENEEFALELPASLRTRLEGVSTFPLDRYGTTLDSNFFFLPQARIGAHVESRRDDWPVRLQFDYEHDVATGTENGAPRQEIGSRLPNGEKVHDEIRRLFLRITIPQTFLVIGGGYTLSHWGMGMLANDGAHGWTPGSARFSDPRSGDRVLRALISTTPLTDYGIVLRAAWDDVIGDDFLLDGDTAHQYIGSVSVGQGQRRNGGLYVVYRSQDSNLRRGFDATVFDLTGSDTYSIDGLGQFTLAAEGAIVTGSTTLGPTPDFHKHNLLQIGAVLRMSLDRGNHGGVFDFMFASGDENFDDKDQNAFKIDPNYEFGLLLFRQVMAAQTGRATVTASDPTLIGKPVPDLDRIPTGGSPSNTLAFFPRAWWRPEQGLEVYGGPMFALSDAKYADPFNTRINGGDPHNALGGKPGRFYGAELDIGSRYEMLVGTTELSFGLEGGVLFPGDAFHKLNGSTMSEVFGGRAVLECRL